MKKAISFLLMAVLIFSLAACSGGGVDGTYYDETGTQTLVLKDGKVTWTELGISFEGTYELDGKNITVDMTGGSETSSLVYSGTVDGKTITLSGGYSIDNEKFVKK